MATKHQLLPEYLASICDCEDGPKSIVATHVTMGCAPTHNPSTRYPTATCSSMTHSG